MDEVTRMLWGKIPDPETGIEVRKSVCTICDPQTQCGLDCYVKDDRIIKVEGSLENPHSGGTLCAKGAATRQYVYHEERLKTPLRRTGPRGSGRFEPISWDEALQTVADELNRLKAESGPESIVFYVGYPKQMRPFIKRLALQFGSPNYCTESSTCFQAMAMAWRLVYGSPAGPDVRNSRCLLVWTNNPFYGNTTVVRGLLDALDRGLKMIVIDPRRSPIASYADMHLQLKPGTDGALALGMANVIIEEGLYDQEFVAQHTRGFDDFREYAAGFDLAQVERITGVPADQVREAARLYATTKPAALMPGAAPVVQNTNGIQNYRAVFSLVGLTGNFDVVGGNMPAPPSWLEVAGAGFATREHQFSMPRSWDDLPERVGAGRFPVWAELVDQGQSMDLARHIRTGEPYPLRGMMTFGLNYRMFPASNRFLEAVNQLEFICDVDLFLTDTARYADIVLPACSSVERSEIRCYPQKYIIMTEPVIPSLGEARSDTDIIFQLANRLGLEDPMLNPSPSNGLDSTAAFERALDWIFEPSDMTTAELKKHPEGMPVPHPLPNPERKYLEKGFPTPSGKMELKSSLLEKHGYDALPVYRPPKFSPESSPDLAEKYPFTLNAGCRMPMFVHSRTFRLPWTRSLQPEVAADMSPLDAETLGIDQGDQIEIATPAGSIKVLANLSDLVQSGVVHMLHDHREADVNSLVDGDYLDPISGFPGFRSLLCSVRKLEVDAEAGVKEL